VRAQCNALRTQRAASLGVRSEPWNHTSSIAVLNLDCVRWHAFDKAALADHDNVRLVRNDRYVGERVAAVWRAQHLAAPRLAEVCRDLSRFLLNEVEHPARLLQQTLQILDPAKQQNGGVDICYSHRPASVMESIREWYLSIRVSCSDCRFWASKDVNRRRDKFSTPSDCSRDMPKLCCKLLLASELSLAPLMILTTCRNGRAQSRNCVIP